MNYYCLVGAGHGSGLVPKRMGCQKRATLTFLLFPASYLSMEQLTHTCSCHAMNPSVETKAGSIFLGSQNYGMK